MNKKRSRPAGQYLRTWVLVAGIVFSGGCAPLDTVTKLSDDIILIPSTSQMWQVALSGRITDPEDVEQYLDGLNSGDYSDWRLPDKYELETLFAVFDGQGQGALDIRLERFYWLADGGIPYVGTWEPGDQ